MSNPFNRLRGAPRIGCPFCWELIPEPQQLAGVFSPEGCLGGRCTCGAVFVVDETGKSGGQALLDAQALLCDGDLDRAMRLETGPDVEVETRFLRADAGNAVPMRAQGRSCLGAKVWFIRTAGRH